MDLLVQKAKKANLVFKDLLEEEECLVLKGPKEIQVPQGSLEILENKALLESKVKFKCIC